MPVNLVEIDLELTEIFDKNRYNGQVGGCNVSVGRYNKESFKKFLDTKRSEFYAKFRGNLEKNLSIVPWATLHPSKKVDQKSNRNFLGIIQQRQTISQTDRDKNITSFL